MFINEDNLSSPKNKIMFNATKGNISCISIVKKNYH